MAEVLNLQYNEEPTIYKVTFRQREPFWRNDVTWGYSIEHNGIEKIIFATKRLKEEIDRNFDLFPKEMTFEIKSGKYKGYKTSTVNIAN